MYANFIYFILAILIYATYPPTQEPGLPWWGAALAAAGLILGFALFARWSYGRINELADLSAADHRFSAVSTRQAIIAIILFAFLIHGLGLPAYGHSLTVFRFLPTLLALLFLLLFLGLLVIVWSCAHTSYQRLYDPLVKRRAYVLSNIRMSVPIIIPWLLITIVADIIYALPFEGPKQLLSSTEGQVVYFLLFLVTVAVLAPAVIQRFWGCRPLESGFYRERIRALCRRAGIRYRNILYWPIFGGRMLTAGVMGIVHKFRYILVTEALLKTLDPEELDAVIAHEIGHVKKHHLLYYMLFMAGFMLISFAVNDLVIYLILYAKPLYRFLISFGMTQATVVSTLFSLVFFSAFLLYFRFLFGYFMRNFERQADIYVYTLFNTARPMISTFQKISAASGQSPAKPNWHHFSISERVGYLLKCEQDSRWIAHQDRKVRHSLMAYAIGLVLIGGVGYQLNYGQAGQSIGTRFFEEIVEQEIQDNPDDAGLYSLLGDIKYSQESYAATVAAYETALRLDPLNSQVLNNLAWLYATCEDNRVRNPARALDLARRAVELEPTTPHVLDTLAESYFINGDIPAAILYEQKALDAADEPKAHYRQQLERFRQE
ncbi:MAG: M48 family metalloprotease [Desulfosarcina sp.]|nr:M48 family metalloprotease [Desulfobacterales bacterium]